ncbi:MAG TPA: hypothetical protein VFK03_03030 [Candidatus Saccharimonadales bacterium]|nr:hypothetical protein [Candidatus Saccharimonadales bacterium]
MLRIIVLLPQLMWFWRLLQLMEEEDPMGSLVLSPEDLVRQRLAIEADSGLDESPVEARDVITKAKTIVARLADRHFPGASVSEVVCGYNQEKRFLRRTRYEPVFRDLVGWALDDNGDDYLGRDGIIYQFSLLVGAYEPKHLAGSSPLKLELIDRQLNQLAGRYLSGL